MSTNFNEKNYAAKMDKTIQAFKKDLSTLRTGRANSSMLDMVKVDKSFLKDWMVLSILAA